MGPIEFATEAEKRGVADIISDNARIWKNGKLQQVSDFSEIDWEATALELAYALKIERESNDRFFSVWSDDLKRWSDDLKRIESLYAVIETLCQSESRSTRALGGEPK